MGKQVFKIKLPKKWRIHAIFYMSLLEQDTTKKKQVKTAIELDKGDSKKHKVEKICNSTVYVSKSEDYLLGFYYLVS